MKQEINYKQGDYPAFEFILKVHGKVHFLSFKIKSLEPDSRVRQFRDLTRCARAPKTFHFAGHHRDYRV